MNYYVYVLKSKIKNHFYIGITNNLERRLKEHNLGNICWTKRYKPWDILYTETMGNKIEARKREKYLKSHSGRKWVKKNIKPL